MGVCVPEEYGGAGADFLSYMLVLEELSRADAGVGVTVAVHTSAVTLPLLRFGTDEQRARFVPPLARGELLGAFALTEAEAGSDAGALRTPATPEDGGWRIARREAVHHDGRARRHVPPLRAHRPRHARRARRLAFILDADHVRVTRAEEKLGLHSSTTNSIAVDAHVDGDRLLGDEGEGFQVAMATLDGGRIGIAAQARRHRAGRVRRGARVREAAPRLRPARSRSSRRSSTSSPTWRPRSTPRGCSCYRAAAAEADAACRTPRRGEGEALRLGDRAAGRRPRRSRSSAATATRRSSRSSGTTATRRSPRSTRERARSSASSSRARCSGSPSGRRPRLDSPRAARPQ